MEQQTEQRKFLTTAELAARLDINPHSIRQRLSDTGSYYNLRPVKMPNGRLRWPLDAAEQWAGAAA